MTLLFLWHGFFDGTDVEVRFSHKQHPGIPVFRMQGKKGLPQIVGWHIQGMVLPNMDDVENLSVICGG